MFISASHDSQSAEQLFISSIWLDTKLFSVQIYGCQFEGGLVLELRAGTEHNIK